MKTIDELREELRRKLGAAEDLVNKAKNDNRPITEEEEADIDRLTAEAEEIRQEVERREATLRADDKVQEALESMREATSADRRFRLAKEKTEKQPAKPFRYSGKLQGFRSEEDAYAAGQWLRATLFSSDKAQRWCYEHGLMDVETRGHVTGTGYQGGYLVPEVLAQTIIDLREQYGVFGREARTFPMSGDVARIPRVTTNLSAAFAGEASSLTEKSMTFDQIVLTAKKLGFLVKLSTEIAEDAIIDLGQLVATQAAYAMAKKEDECGFIGTGTAAYGGIRGIVDIFENTTTLAGYVECGSGVDSLNQVTAADLANLRGKLPTYVTNPKYYCSKAAKAVIFDRLQMASGGVTKVEYAGATIDAFHGDPIVVTQTMFKDTSDTAGNNKVMALYGDLSISSTIGRRRDMNLMRSDDRYMDTDEIGIKITERFDIENHDYGDATDAGPIVALIGQT